MPTGDRFILTQPPSDLETLKLPRFAHARARRLVESPRELLRVIEQARRKQTSARTTRGLKPVLAELRTMLQLMQAWAGRKYSSVSNTHLVLIVGAVVYFLMPTDLVPDFIPGLGLVDDAAVIAWVVGAVRDELAKFRAWRPADEEPGEELRAVDSRAESGNRQGNQDQSTDNE